MFGATANVRLLSVIVVVLLNGASLVFAEVEQRTMKPGESESVKMGDITLELKFVSSDTTAELSNSYGTALYRMSRLGGTCSKLCDVPTSIAGSPDLSRDGTKLAFDGWQEHNGEQFQDSHIFSLDLGSLHQVNDLGPGAMPSWSQDGRNLTLSQYNNHRVSLMAADGSDQQLLDSKGWSAEWAPDGAKIAYTIYDDQGANLVLYDVDVRQRRSLFTNGEISFIRWGLTWSPDSKRLCALAKDSDNQKILVVVHAEGEYHERRIISSKIPVSIMESLESPIARGSDGQQVIFAAKDPGSNLRRLFALDISGDHPPVEVSGLPKEIHCTQPYWHPDGTIIFVGIPDKAD